MQSIIISITINITLLLLLAYLAIKYFDLRNKFIDTKRQLNSQTLDYHLSKIKDAGYDFTLKGAKGKSTKSRNSIKKSKHMNELLDD
ncbi:MAG: hypothetical protein ACMXYG_06655 [Candidatus Woesearchaeota archaeon]